MLKLLASLAFLCALSPHRAFGTPSLDGSPRQSAVQTACRNVEEALRRGPIRSDLSPITRLVGEFKRGKSLEEIGRDTALLDQVAGLLDDGVSSAAISDGFVSAVHVDAPPQKLAPDVHGVGNQAIRAYVFILLKQRAVTLRKTDVPMSQRYFRACASWCAVDWFANGYALPSIVSEAKRRNVSIGELFGASDATASMLNDAALKIDEAQRDSTKLLSSCAIAVDRVIFSLKRKELVAREFQTAISEMRNCVRGSAGRSDTTAWTACNIAWRLRSAIALLDHDGGNRLTELDAVLVELETGADTELSKRWLREARTTKPVEPANSGVHVVTDPNDPRLKGTPPQ